MGRYMIVGERREGGEVHDSEGEEGGWGGT